MASSELTAIQIAKRKARARLLSIPGVHAVGIGPKKVGGQPTNEIAIIVYVLEKRSPEEISVEEFIPSNIDGFKTDIVQSGMPSRSVNDDPDNVNDDGSKPRPLIGGVQVQADQKRPRILNRCFAWALADRPLEPTGRRLFSRCSRASGRSLATA